MAALCGMLTIQYSAQSAWLSVHKLFTSCIGRVPRPSITSLIVDGDWLPAMSDVSVIYLYLPYPIQACFSSTSLSHLTQWRTWFMQYQTSDVDENLGNFSCMECTRQGNDFELIPMVKMEIP